MSKLLQAAIESARKTGHSLFSPSGAAKYMNCPGSVWMEREYENGSNKHADLGSDKHELSEIVLRKGTEAENYLGRIMTYGNEVDQQFADEVNYYADAVRRFADGAVFTAYEMGVDLSQIKQIEGEGGTADAVVLHEDGTLYIIDAKFGYGKVPAKENLQLLEYGLGVFEEMDKLGLTDDIAEVCLVIVQPQHDLIDDWAVGVSSLLAHRNKVRKAVEDACAPFNGEEPVLVPGEKQCRWCRAFADCPAAKDVVLKTVTGSRIDPSEFDDLDLTHDIKEEVRVTIPVQRVKSLAQSFSMIDYIHDWCKAVGERMHEVIEKDGPQAGYKLVAGKKGNRAFRDAEEAETIMRAARLKLDDMFTRKLKTPTQLEKVLKGDKPRVWNKLKPLVVQADGKPTVVPESDKRPALPATASQFDDLV